MTRFLPAPRLETSLRLIEILREVGPAEQRAAYVDAIAEGLGCDRAAVRRAAHDLIGMRLIATDKAVADDVARDLVDGLLDLARIARDQWAVHAGPVDIRISTAPADRPLLLGDCVVLISELGDGEWAPSDTAIIWDDVMSYEDEAALREGEHAGNGRPLQIVAFINPTTAVIATRLSDEARTGRYEEVELEPEQVDAINEAVVARSSGFVIASQLTLRKRRSATLGFDEVVPVSVELVGGQVDRGQLGV